MKCKLCGKPAFGASALIEGRFAIHLNCSMGSRTPKKAKGKTRGVQASRGKKKKNDTTFVTPPIVRGWRDIR